MIKVNNIDVWGFEHSLRGMRNPMNSHFKADSEYKNNQFVIGKNDLDLMKRLFKAGTEHRKYLRQIMVSMDITAPLYWFKEFDTYRIGITENSTSTMHKIHAKEFVREDFSLDNFSEKDLGHFDFIIKLLNSYREEYLETKNKDVWYKLIRFLPSSYNQIRTITMNYENVFNMIHQREFHKLDEWKEFVAILKELPYIKELLEE